MVVECNACHTACYAYVLLANDERSLIRVLTGPDVDYDAVIETNVLHVRQTFSTYAK